MLDLVGSMRVQGDRSCGQREDSGIRSCGQCEGSGC